MSKAAELRYIPKKKKTLPAFIQHTGHAIKLFVLFNNDENNSEQCYYLSNNYVLIMSLVCQR